MFVFFPDVAITVVWSNKIWQSRTEGIEISKNTAPKLLKQCLYLDDAINTSW